MSKSKVLCFAAALLACAVQLVAATKTSLEMQNQVLQMYQGYNSLPMGLMLSLKEEMIQQEQNNTVSEDEEDNLEDDDENLLAQCQSMSGA
jgi:malate/lactate dehydrogenase